MPLDRGADTTRWCLGQRVLPSPRPADSRVDIFLRQTQCIYLLSNPIQLRSRGFDYDRTQKNFLTAEANLEIIRLRQSIDDRLRQRDVVLDGFFGKHIYP